MKARDIMTPQPEVVTASDSIQRAAEIMREFDVGFVPIVDDRTSMALQGVITDRDIAIRHVAAGHAQPCKVHDHMTGGPIETVDVNSDLKQVLAIMKRAQLRRIPVVEGNGRIVGVIAQADVAVKDTSRNAQEVADMVEKISEPATPQR